MTRSYLCIFGAIAALGVFAFAIYSWLPDLGMADKVAGIVQASVAALAIIAGGVFAVVKLEVFRTFVPHLRIGHEVSHRRVGDSYIHIGVVVTLSNSSKVATRISSGEYLLQQVSPYTDSEIEFQFLPVPNSHNEYIDWPVLDEQCRIWDEPWLTVDPGESLQVAFESIVPLDTKAVLTYSFFNNPKFHPGYKVVEGWSATSFYDIAARK